MQSNTLPQFGPTLCLSWLRHSLLLEKNCLNSRFIPSPCAHQSLGTWRRHRTTRPWRSPLNAWLGRSIVFSFKTWPSKSTDGELLAKSLSICCTMLTSVIKLTVASSSSATAQSKRTTRWRSLWLQVVSVVRPRRDLAAVASAAAAV